MTHAKPVVVERRKTIGEDREVSGAQFGISFYMYYETQKADELNFLQNDYPRIVSLAHLHRNVGGWKRGGFGSRCQGVPRGQVPNGGVSEGGHQCNLQVSDCLAPKLSFLI